MTTKQRLVERYTTDNRQAAMIIAADPAKYGGDDSLMVRWAHSILEEERPRLPWRLVA
jgi:hypothetical protein